MAEFEIKMNKLSLMEVIIKAVDDISDPAQAQVLSWFLRSTTVEAEVLRDGTK